MKCITSWKRVAPAVLGAALLLGIAPETHLADARAQTRDDAELTAQWWQWALGIPTPQNPQLDETGAFAGVGQPFKGSKVFFLCGVFGTSSTAERAITVPQGTAFFFPLVNYVFIDSIGRGKDPANNPTVPQMYAIVEAAMDTAEDLFVTVDGVDLTAFAERVQSPPFAVRLPDDNVFGAPGGVYSPGVSDGYWFYLPPLQPGTHTLTFGGSAFGGGFTLDITYQITVE